MALFDEEPDPVAVIKWKEVLDMREEATDQCEDVADLPTCLIGSRSS